MPTLYTIGHSTHSLEDFISSVRAHSVKAIADVRLIPRSRRYPHFNDESLAISLPETGIDYLPFKDLGGRRKARPDSINLGWRNESFRGYADFLQTDNFRKSLDRLIDAAKERPTAIMCAEAVPWRCHRSLIADAMVVRGWEVLDIMSRTSAKEHKLPDFAKVEDGVLTYPAEQDRNSLFDPT
jgi:uncharacterized protein (DUF488 family)